MSIFNCILFLVLVAEKSSTLRMMFSLFWLFSHSCLTLWKNLLAWYFQMSNVSFVLEIATQSPVFDCAPTKKKRISPYVILFRYGIVSVDRKSFV